MQILGLGLPELIVITLILLLFFGAKRLPTLFRSIGSSISELKEGLAQGEKEATELKEKATVTDPLVATDTTTKTTK